MLFIIQYLAWTVIKLGWEYSGNALCLSYFYLLLIKSGKDKLLLFKKEVNCSMSLLYIFVKIILASCVNSLVLIELQVLSNLSSPWEYSLFMHWINRNISFLKYLF